MAMEPMFSEDNRLASFKPSAAVSSSSSSSKRRQTRADPTTPVWPYSTAKTSTFPSPAVLAKYGFYFAPDEDSPDRTVHYLYETALSDWSAGDDPLERLEAVLPGNGWCRLWRSKAIGKLAKDVDDGDEGRERWTWTEAELMPNSKQMVEARKETFASSWPYDGKKGWKPTSKKLAEAGFHFTPTDEEPDTATCAYCKKVLEGWEKGDDPVNEHREREPDCAFFTCTLVEAETATSAAETDGDEAEDDTGAVLSRKPKRVVSTYSKRTTTRGKKATRAEAAAEESVSEADTDAGDKDADTNTEAEMGNDEEEEEKPKPVKRATRKAKTASTRVKKLIHDDEDDSEDEAGHAEEEAAPAASKASAKEVIGKGRPNTTAAKTTRTASRSTSRAVAKSKKATTASDAEVEAVEVEPTRPPPAEETPMPRKASRARGRSKKAQTPEEAEESEAAAEAEPPVAEAAESEIGQEADGTIVEHPSASASEVEADEEEQEEQPEAEPTPKPKRRGKAATTTTKAKTAKKAKDNKKTAVAKPKRGGTKGSKKDAAETTETEVETEAEPETEAESELEPEVVVEAAIETESEPQPEVQQQQRQDDVEMVKEPVPDARADETLALSKGAWRRKVPGCSDEVDAPSSEAMASSYDRSSSPAPLRSPLAQLEKLNTLELTEEERSLTLGQWLQLKADDAAEEMRLEGERQIRDLENRMAQGRITIERTLRGRG